MADTIWIPDPTAIPDDDGFRLLVCVQTNRRLYVLVDGPPPPLPPLPAGQTHHVRVHTDTGEPAAFISGGTAIDRQRTTVTAWFTALPDPPEQLDIQLDIADRITMRVLAVRLPHP